MKITKYEDWDGTIPALVSGMPNEAYHAHDSISNSGLSLINRSPGHYFYSPPWRGTRFTEIGTAFHTALLEPDRYAAEYIVVDGVNDRRQAAYSDAAKAYGGAQTLTETEGASVAVMRESIWSNTSAREILEQPGHAELSAFAQCPDTGVIMRCRFDWVTESGVILDLKKTQDCREFKFSRSVNEYRYHVQAAMYSDIYKFLHDAGLIETPLRAYKILAVEENPPCANILYDLDPLALMYGEKLYRQDMETYAQCAASGCWESYSGTGVVTLPEWVLNQMMEEMENE